MTHYHTSITSAVMVAFTWPTAPCLLSIHKSMQQEDQSTVSKCLHQTKLNPCHGSSPDKSKVNLLFFMLYLLAFAGLHQKQEALTYRSFSGSTTSMFYLKAASRIRAIVAEGSDAQSYWLSDFPNITFITLHSFLHHWLRLHAQLCTQNN